MFNLHRSPGSQHLYPGPGDRPSGYTGKHRAPEDVKPVAPVTLVSEALTGPTSEQRELIGA
jgi:hypothetical protein